MRKANLEMTNCNQCPFLGRYDYSTDGWDRVEDWTCKKENKKIASCVDWHQTSKVEIPEWCPLTKENKK